MLALDVMEGTRWYGLGAGVLMENTEVERWQKLYEQAQSEKDPQKLSELVFEIHRLLREKESESAATKRELRKSAI